MVAKSNQTASLCVDSKGVHKHPIWCRARNAHLHLVQKNDFKKQTLQFIMTFSCYAWVPVRSLRLASASYFAKAS